MWPRAYLVWHFLAGACRARIRINDRRFREMSAGTAREAKCSLSSIYVIDCNQFGFFVTFGRFVARDN